jgi:restriction system protein
MSGLFLGVLFAGIVWLVWISVNKSNPPAQQGVPSPKEEPHIRDSRNTLQFAKTQREISAKKQREQEAWHQAYGLAKAGELDQLSGTEFEEFLAGLFRTRGYATELTPVTGYDGADLILIKGGRRIAVQAKRRAGSVGIAAVQEALSGQVSHRCDIAWVVTTGTFTTNAIELAKKSGVRLIERRELGHLIASQRASANDDAALASGQLGSGGA